MSDRIEKLSDQARRCFRAQQCVDPAFLEKFAQLIVQECVTIINYGIDHTDYPHPNDVEKSMIEMKAQMWCRDAIKEHFGLDTYTK